MRRADRLFQIVQLLRRRRTLTAAQLGERLEVSERTVYRDIADLMGSGIPILGEAGVGYRLGQNFELPPLMLTVDEVRALVFGVRMVETWADPEMRVAAKNALDKIEAVVPEKEKRKIDDTAMFALSYGISEELRRSVGTLRRCVEERQKVLLRYTDKEERTSQRVICPLGLYFWGSTWTVGAWCELREDFRSFRIDRIVNAECLNLRFEAAGPLTIDAFMAARHQCETETSTRKRTASSASVTPASEQAEGADSSSIPSGVQVKPHFSGA